MGSFVARFVQGKGMEILSSYSDVQVQSVPKLRVSGSCTMVLRFPAILPFERFLDDSQNIVYSSTGYEIWSTVERQLLGIIFIRRSCLLTYFILPIFFRDGDLFMLLNKFFFRTVLLLLSTFISFFWIFRSYTCVYSINNVNAIVGNFSIYFVTTKV